MPKNDFTRKIEDLGKIIVVWMALNGCPKCKKSPNLVTLVLPYRLPTNQPTYNTTNLPTFLLPNLTTYPPTLHPTYLTTYQPYNLLTHLTSYLPHCLPIYLTLDLCIYYSHVSFFSCLFCWRPSCSWAPWGWWRRCRRTRQELGLQKD